MSVRWPPDILRGQRVLVVHEDAFWSAYIAEVVADRGATLTGSVRSVIDALALLDREPRPSALVFSNMVGDVQRLVDQVASGRLMTVVLQPYRGAPRPEIDACRVLDAPYAGFQVVDALADMLAARGHGPAGFVGPHRRGH